MDSDVILQEEQTRPSHIGYFYPENNSICGKPHETESFYSVRPVSCNKYLESWHHQPVPNQMLIVTANRTVANIQFHHNSVFVTFKNISDQL